MKCYRKSAKIAIAKTEQISPVFDVVVVVVVVDVVSVYVEMVVVVAGGCAVEGSTKSVFPAHVSKSTSASC